MYRDPTPAQNPNSELSLKKTWGKDVNIRKKGMHIHESERHKPQNVVSGDSKPTNPKQQCNAQTTTQKTKKVDSLLSGSILRGNDKERDFQKV